MIDPQSQTQKPLTGFLARRQKKIAVLLFLNAILLLQFLPKRTHPMATPSPAAFIPKAPEEKPFLVVAPDLEVMDVSLYEADFSSRARPEFTPAGIIRRAPKHAYGWVMRLRTTREKVNITEKLKMPSAPTHWGLSKDTKITEGGKVAVTSKSIKPTRGLITNFWGFSEGDPAGWYEITLSVEGVSVKKLGFQVQ